MNLCVIVMNVPFGAGLIRSMSLRLFLQMHYRLTSDAVRYAASGCFHYFISRGSQATRYIVRVALSLIRTARAHSFRCDLSSRSYGRISNNTCARWNSKCIPNLISLLHNVRRCTHPLKCSFRRHRTGCCAPPIEAPLSLLVRGR